MTIIEKKCIRLCGDGNSTWGHIELTHLAKPQTMKITLDGENIIPERFNIYGEPIISEEMAMLYKWKEDQLRRNPETKDVLLIAEISYDTDDFSVPITEFNSVHGIEKSLMNLDSFNEMLNRRRIWRKYTGDYLNKYVIFGKYILDEFGQVLTVIETENSQELPPVCTYDFFIIHMSSFRASYTTYIPEPGTRCPGCGKKFTINDLRDNKFGLINGKISHDSCRRNYYHNLEIDKMSRCLVDLVYDEKPKFDLLPNGYCSRECCSHKPWFMFHTSDGDIKIGWRKHVISIEWQENFKPFDIAIFNSEDVTKWCDDTDIYKAVEPGTNPTNVKRGIHAWDKHKALEYLRKVKETVNQKK